MAYVLCCDENGLVEPIFTLRVDQSILPNNVDGPLYFDEVPVTRDDNRNVVDGTSERNVSSINKSIHRRNKKKNDEQKRRDAIKTGYDCLHQLLIKSQKPNAIRVGNRGRLSNEEIVYETIDYINFLVMQRQKLYGEIKKLQNEVSTLKIMYADQETMRAQYARMREEEKFQFFMNVVDGLFSTFSNDVNFENVHELSTSVFGWLEKHCAPQELRNLFENELKKRQNYHASTIPGTSSK